MKQVHAIDNYATGAYVIRDTLGNEHVVTAQATRPSIWTEVPGLTVSQ
jgi:hypothetical protein